MRGLAIACAAAALLALGACDNTKGEGKTELSSADRVAQALDVCADGADGYLCQNSALSSLDGQVRETLVAESASVSDAGAELLVQSQARWREMARITCGLLDAETPPTPDQQSCLESEFRARVQDARNAVQQQGGYTFQRMEVLNATPVAGEIAAAMGDSAPVAIERNIRFPRIDGPQTPEIRRFNELVQQQPQYGLEDATNESVDYVIGFAGPELISVKFIVSADAVTAANSFNTVKAVTVVMLDGGRSLTEADVFRANSGWQDYITRVSVTQIARQFPDYPNFPPRRDVYETATKPHLWLITENALVIMFPPLSFGGSHADGGVDVTIPWRDLRDYLNPAAPAPIRPAA